MNKRVFTKTHEDTQDMMSNGTNPFMYFIYNKKRHNFFWWLKMRRFLYYLDHLSPSFNMLRAICDFIKLLSILFAYKNDPNNELYAYTELKNGVSSFRVTKKDQFNLEYTLYDNDRSIAIKFTRLSEGGGVSTAYFRDGEAIIVSKEDNLFFHNIINWTMKPVKELFVIYYNIAPELEFIEPSQVPTDAYIFKHTFKNK